MNMKNQVGGVCSYVQHLLLKQLNLKVKINLLKICKDLYPIPRSITGIGVVKILDYLKNYFPLEIKKIKSGKKAFDWTIPPEWNIKSAFIKDVKTGKKIISYLYYNI